MGSVPGPNYNETLTFSASSSKWYMDLSAARLLTVINSLYNNSYYIKNNYHCGLLWADDRSNLDWCPVFHCTGLQTQWFHWMQWFHWINVQLHTLLYLCFDWSEVMFVSCSFCRLHAYDAFMLCHHGVVSFTPQYVCVNDCESPCEMGARQRYICSDPAVRSRVIIIWRNSYSHWTLSVNSVVQRPTLRVS